MQRDKETILGHHREKSVDNRENKPYPKSRSSHYYSPGAGGRVGFDINESCAGPLMRSVRILT